MASLLVCPQFMMNEIIALKENLANFDVIKNKKMAQLSEIKQELLSLTMGVIETQKTIENKNDMQRKLTAQIADNKKAYTSNSRQLELIRLQIKTQLDQFKKYDSIELSHLSLPMDNAEGIPKIISKLNQLKEKAISHSIFINKSTQNKKEQIEIKKKLELLRLVKHHLVNHLSNAKNGWFPFSSLDKALKSHVNNSILSWSNSFDVFVDLLQKKLPNQYKKHTKQLWSQYRLMNNHPQDTIEFQKDRLSFLNLIEEKIHHYQMELDRLDDNYVDEERFAADIEKLIQQLSYFERSFNEGSMLELTMNQLETELTQLEVQFQQDQLILANQTRKAQQKKHFVELIETQLFPLAEQYTRFFSDEALKRLSDLASQTDDEPIENAQEIYNDFQQMMTEFVKMRNLGTQYKQEWDELCSNSDFIQEDIELFAQINSSGSVLIDKAFMLFERAKENIEQIINADKLKDILNGIDNYHIMLQQLISMQNASTVDRKNFDELKKLIHYKQFHNELTQSIDSLKKEAIQQQNSSLYSNLLLQADHLEDYTASFHSAFSGRDKIAIQLIEDLDNYLIERKKRYAIKDILTFFISNDATNRAEFVSKIQSAIIQYATTGSYEELLKTIQESEKKFPGLYFSSLIHRIAVTVKQFEEPFKVLIQDKLPKQGNVVTTLTMEQSALSIHGLQLIKQHINQLRDFGKQFMIQIESDPPSDPLNCSINRQNRLGQTAIQLSDELEHMLMQFINNVESNPMNKDQFEEFTLDFYRKLHSQDDVLSNHANQYTPIIINIAAAFCSFGLLLGIRLLLTKLMYGHAMFFWQSESLRYINAIEESFLACLKYDKASSHVMTSGNQVLLLEPSESQSPNVINPEIPLCSRELISEEEIQLNYFH